MNARSRQRQRQGRAIARYLLGRLLGGVLILLAATVFTFFTLRALPGNPVLALLGGPTAAPSPEMVARVTQELGLDKPLAEQYFLYLTHLAAGDLGQSYSQHLPVAQILREQFGATLALTVSALALAWVLSLLTVLATAQRSPWLSRLGSAIETVSSTLPPFWLALVLITLFAFHWQLFPSGGNDGPLSLVLPTVALAVPLAGFMAQVTRESFEIAMDQPFILSARTRGLTDLAVRLRHALRHAVLPGIALSAWAMGALIGNAVLIETIFSRQGLGRELYGAVSLQDAPLTIGISLIIAITYVVGSILADCLYVLVDPRLKAVLA